MQTQFILEAMSKTSDEGNTRCDQIMGNFDLLFAQINDLGLSQQELKTQVTAAQEVSDTRKWGTPSKDRRTA